MNTYEQSGTTYYYAGQQQAQQLTSDQQAAAAFLQQQQYAQSLAQQQEVFARMEELSRQNAQLQASMQSLMNQPQAGPSQMGPYQQPVNTEFLVEVVAKTVALMNNQNRKVETVKPDFYNGLKHEDLEMWIKQVSTYMELQRTHENTQAMQASQFLRGTASTWFHNLKSPPATWAELKELLQKQFESLNKHETAMKTLFLNLAVGKHSKGVQDLGIAFQEHLAVIESDPDCQLPEKVKVFLYRTALKEKHNEAAKAIVSRKPATLAEAITIAVDIQNVVRTVEAPAREFPARDNRRDDHMDLGAMRKPDRPVPTEAEKSELERRKNDRLCLNCGKEGHTSTSCTADPEGTYAKKFQVWRKSVAKSGQKARQASGNGRQAARKDGQ